MKKEGYKLYELEPDVVQLIANEKKTLGIAKDFTVNKSIEYFFEETTDDWRAENKYEFNPVGRKRVYVYLNLDNWGRLSAESMLVNMPFNCIVNRAVKFYLNNKV